MFESSSDLVIIFVIYSKFKHNKDSIFLSNPIPCLKKNRGFFFEKKNPVQLVNGVTNQPKPKKYEKASYSPILTMQSLDSLL